MQCSLLPTEIPRWTWAAAIAARDALVSGESDGWAYRVIEHPRTEGSWAIQVRDETGYLVGYWGPR